MPVVTPLPVCQIDLDNLSASGLTRSTIQANGLRTQNGALVFPYRGLDGNVNDFNRRRLHKPVIGKNGKLIRYLQPPGSPLRAYLPAGGLDKLRDGVSPVYITEREKKALALSQLGLAAVGIGGIWSGCKKNSTELIDDLAAIAWTDRVVYIVFDYEPKASTRREAELARLRLARALKAKGAGEVYNVELPEGRGRKTR